jgi:hypothetical protein
MRFTTPTYSRQGGPDQERKALSLAVNVAILRTPYVRPGLFRASTDSIFPLGEIQMYGYSICYEWLWH